MHKKAILKTTVIYTLLTILFLAGISGFIWLQKNGTSIWSNYYGKEFTRTVNLAKSGDNITLDIHKATEIAAKNNVKSTSEIFTVDNPKNEVCVKLTRGIKTCYKYFNDVDIINLKPESASGTYGETNILTFEIVEKQKNV